MSIVDYVLCFVFQCEICYNEITNVAEIVPTCDHSFCKDCWTEYVLVLFSFSSLLHFDSSCGLSFTPYFIM